jgi:PleD family two-component response regulator
MTVLIADDDRGIRLALQRVLNKLGCTCIEASDGMEALDILADTPVSFVCLDLGMPGLGGLEVLQALRRSKEHAQLPVVVISGTSDQASAAEAIGLGVTDYLTKPLQAETVLARIKRVIDSLRPPSVDRLRPLGAIAPATRVLIVDGDAEFRHFVVAALAGYVVEEAASAHAAFLACAKSSPDVVLVGQDIGSFGPQFFARRLRGLSQLSKARFVLVASKNVQQDRAVQSVFDAIMARTFVPQTFQQQFEQLFDRSEPPALPDLVGTLRRTLTSAVEQALGMMAHTEISALVDAPPATKAEVVIGVTLNLLNSPVAIDLELACPVASAKRIAARMVETIESKVTQDDAVAAVAELVNVVAGRMRTAVIAGGDTARCTLPRVVPKGRALSGEGDLRLAFGSAANDLTFWLTVSARRRELAETA